VSEPTSARAAAAESLISNLIAMGVMVGVSLLLAKRDWVTRQAMALRAAIAKEHRRYRAEREVAEFRRQVSEFDHGDR